MELTPHLCASPKALAALQINLVLIYICAVNLREPAQAFVYGTSILASFVSKPFMSV